MPNNLATIGAAELKHIEIGKLVAHPKNPRLMVREDVVGAIAATLIQEKQFREEYAIRVRPVKENYEIISGHHRVEAARRAKIATLPCWVREMDDETAFMDLVRSNAQGELSPLEIGMHALESVQLGVNQHTSEEFLSLRNQVDTLERRVDDLFRLLEIACKRLNAITDRF